VVPWPSKDCALIRMTNEDVIDLFDRVKLGATVVVLAPGQSGGDGPTVGIRLVAVGCGIEPGRSVDMKMQATPPGLSSENSQPLASSGRIVFRVRRPN
jgi:hypothetical protein